MYTPKPTRLGHLVIKVRNLQKSVDFYRDVVGLRESDWIDDRMVFMRAGTDHHDLALLQLPPDAVARPEGHGAPLPTASLIWRNPWRSSCCSSPSKTRGTRSGPS